MTTLIPSLLALLLTPTAAAADAPAPGNLVITEVMANPRYVTPGSGEWIEVTNVSGKTVNLNGLQVSSSGAQGFTVSQDFFLGAGGAAVIASDTNDAGLPRVDVRYDAALLPLDNSGDDVTIGFEGTQIDAANFRSAWGSSAQLNPATLDATANDSSGAWCTPVSAYGSGNLGTPGQANDSCPATLGALLPGDLIVSELMIDPLATRRGEWIEVQNLSDWRINLNGLEVATTTALMVIDTAIVLEPGEVAVIANYATANGGVNQVDWAANGLLTLDDTADEVLLSYAGTEFHRFAYDAAVDPVYAGTTLRVDSTMAANGDYDDASAWCVETVAYRTNDHGTPGEDNGDCGIDVDGDGVRFEADCDDSNADSHPWADEICDAEDNDCNGIVDDGALDVSTFWTDADGDGYGDPSRSMQACTLPTAAAARAGDCDDSDPTSFPSADEICDGVDNDCDTRIDESAVDASTYYLDADKDGFGSAATALTACEAPEGYAAEGGDCDDTRWAVRPGAEEVCDLLDNDCDGATDEDAIDGQTYYADADRDGYGSSTDSISACSQPAGYVLDAGDCDDTTGLAHPGAHEVCDTVDNNCDGTVDEGVLTTWYADADADGYGDPATTEQACSAPAGYIAVARDCNDADASVSPAETEHCDRIDNDCNGVVDECGGNKFYADADGDGFGDPSTEVDACFAPEGYVTDSNDCDDTDANHFPGNAEVCDGVDNDCDGEADEGLDQDWYADADADGYGDSTEKVVACAQPDGYVLDNNDCDDSTALSFPGNTEVCDELDNDCDRQIDENVTTTFWRDRDDDGFGEWGSDIQACSLPEGYADNASDCEDRDDTAYPGGVETCDQVDNDCDGSIDEGLELTFYKDVDRDGYGNADATKDACAQPAGYVDNADDCDDWKATSFPGAEETCDGADNDCDGAVDEEGVATFYFDADGDGYGTNEVTVETCPAPAGYVRSGGDCDDADPTRSPGEKEVCDGIDNNCRGGVDEELTKSWYADLDGDGYGDPDAPADFCKADADPVGYVSNDSDCNDADASIKPWAQETCDGVDQDCDGEIDDNTGVVGYIDADGDGYGDPATAVESCNMEAGYIPQGGDCDDTDDETHPLAAETCDAIDNNCDGEIDEGLDETFYADHDGDGVGVETETIEACELPAGYAATFGDCDDSEPLRRPGREEVCDGLDNNCNDAVDEGVTTEFFADADGDGFGDDDTMVEACELAAGLSEDGGDCDDADASAFPGNTETCDEVDNNCDEQVDEGVQTLFYADRDGDGLGNPNDTLGACEQPEGYVTDSTDCDDADGVSGNLLVFYIDQDGDGRGHPSETIEACEAPAGYSAFSDDCDDEDPNNFPTNIETCDGLDNNCNVAADEGATTLFFADVDADGYGDALDVVESCSAPEGYVADDTDCDDTQPSINPGMDEVCDELDNNCDDQIDEGVSTAFWADRDVDGYGDPDVMVLACDAHVCETECFFVENDDDCDDDRADVHPGMDEVCDGLDNDCDAEVDEDLRGTFYADVDGDGYGDADSPVESCGPDAVAVTDSTDCDDADAEINPGATEACDALDNDCDGAVDEDAACETDEPTATEVVFCSAADGEHRVVDGGLLGQAFATTADELGAAAVATYDGNPGWTAEIDGAEWIWDEEFETEPGTRQAHTIARFFDLDADATLLAATLELAADDTYIVAMNGDVLTEDQVGSSFRQSVLIDLTKNIEMGQNRLDIEVTNDAHPGSSATSNPGGLAYCLTLTLECTGEDCGDDAAMVEETYWLDADGDGYGDPLNPITIEVPAPPPGVTAPPAAPAGYVDNDADCDDTDAEIHPFAAEVCNLLDDDCDGELDEGLGQAFYADVDGDGYGDPADGIISCEAPEGFVTDDTDCDDLLSSVNPGMDEVCDALDNDCDDDADEGLDEVWYLDADADGFGDAGQSLLSCQAEGDFATQDATDCDDDTAEINPLAIETCDERDNDCDALVDEDVQETFYADADDDGYGDPKDSVQACEAPEGFVSDDTDCDDDAAAIHPDAEEVCDDRDNDCDGAIDMDECDATPATAKALWVRTDGLPHSAPDNQGRHGSSQAAALLEAQGLGWDSVRLSEVEFDAELLESYELVILFGKGTDGPLTDAQAEDLEGFVTAGGGLLYHTFHPSAKSCAMLDSLPESFGLGCVTGNRVIRGDGTPVMEHALTQGVEQVRVNGGEQWEVFGAAQVVVAHTQGTPMVTATELGAGRVVGIADEWPLYNAGTSAKWDIGAVDNRQLVENTFCWLATDACDIDPTWFLDADGDGHGDASDRIQAAVAPEGYVADDTDCDDADDLTHPGARELCDGLDNDCDGTVDEDAICQVEETLSFCSAADGTTRVLANPKTPAGVTELSELGEPAVAVAFVHKAWTAAVDGAEWVWETPLPTAPQRNQEATLAMPFTLPEEMALVRATLSIAADNKYEARINGTDVSPGATANTFRKAESWDVTDAIDTGANRLDVRVTNWGGSNNPRSNPAGALFCVDLDVTCEGACPEPELQTWYLDADGDGYGDAATATEAASAPAGHVADSTDCDDGEARVHPAGTETCDDLDNDCDGMVDEGMSLTWYLDADADGYGTLARSVESCAPFGEFTAVDPRDCDDTDATVSPAATETCDGRDNDCDREIDEELGQVYFADLDGDGYGSDETVTACEQPSGTALRAGDCDDDASDIHPGAEDTCDHIDNDCDGTTDEDPEYTYNADHDNDGYGDPVEFIAACAPPAGYIADDTDCDDSDRSTHPGAEERCDGIDNDCDGAIESTDECPVETTYTVCSAEDGWNRQLVNPSADLAAASLDELGPWATEARESKSWKAEIAGADWIWIDSEDDGNRQAQDATFARPFELGEGVEVLSATLDIAADRFFEARINGERVAEDERGTSRRTATSWDVTEALRSGWNRLDVDVEGAGNSSDNASPAGLLYCLSIEVECEGAACPELDDDSRVTDRDDESDDDGAGRRGGEKANR